MRRRLAAPLAAAALCAAAPAARAQSAPPAPSPPPARPALAAKLAECLTGPDAADRAATFTASMPRIAHAQRMSMRFDLFERAPRRRWKRVAVPKWGLWERSQGDVPGFIYTKRVAGLEGPASYRAVVRFRWYSASGRLLRAAQRVTRACAQPDPRPDLHAGLLTAAAGQAPGTAAYQLVVRNRGLGPAGAFDTTLTVAGAPAAVARLGGLGAGAQQTLGFSAPRCAPGSTVGVVLDARGEVAEADEADDVLTRPCPFTT